jgi:hypothetical protein
VICRNYVSIPFSRLEGLLSAFPRLISPSQQHSYVETAEARYLFQSLDQFFLVLITSKTSNLLKDLEVLRLAGRIVASQCPQIEESSLLRRYSDIVFAFDEIVTFGQREQITMPQVTANLAMESAEEALQELIEKVLLHQCQCQCAHQPFLLYILPNSRTRCRKPAKLAR